MQQDMRKQNFGPEGKSNNVLKNVVKTSLGTFTKLYKIRRLWESQNLMLVLKVGKSPDESSSYCLIHISFKYYGEVQGIAVVSNFTYCAFARPISQYIESVYQFSAPFGNYFNVTSVIPYSTQFFILLDGSAYFPWQRQYVLPKPELPHPVLWLPTLRCLPAIMASSCFSYDQ